jgi:hypothetical protein
MTPISNLNDASRGLQIASDYLTKMKESDPKL